MLYYELSGLAKPAAVATPDYITLLQFLELYELVPLLDQFPTQLIQRPAEDIALLKLTHDGLLLGQHAVFDSLVQPLTAPRPGYATRTTHVAHYRRLLPTAPTPEDVRSAAY